MEISPPFPFNAIQTDVHHSEPLFQTICIYKMSNLHLQFISLLPDLNIVCLISNGFLWEFLDIKTAILQMRNPVPGKLFSVF